MAKISVYDMTGAVVSDLELNDNIFGIEPNTVVMHAAVVNYPVSYTHLTLPTTVPV